MKQRGVSKLGWQVFAAVLALWTALFVLACFFLDWTALIPIGSFSLGSICLFFAVVFSPKGS
jgi:hypothetical protein